MMPTPHPYQVATPVYEGPLDLLLHLIERAELDITRLSLAQVTDQFLAYMQTLDLLTASEVSAFLVVAARLVQIKSEALLPHPPRWEPDDEDPGEALARQLIVYKRYKEIAVWLGEREARGARTYVRIAPPGRGAPPPRLELDGVGLADLLRAARHAFSAPPPKSQLNEVIAAPRVTIREKIHLLITSLRRKGRLRFSRLVNGVRTRLEVVVSFLAVLEMVKLKRITVNQPGLFQDFEIVPAADWDDDEDFELEFGE